MLYLIGLGLSERSFNKETEEILLRADKIYLETYTVDYPYNVQELESNLKIKKKIIFADRIFVEQGAQQLFKEAKKSDIALLIYGSPLMATTHISLIQEAKKYKVKTRVIHNASIFDAVGETGLQLYKFGKIASIPNLDARSYIDVIKENQKIKAHTLILVDINMDFEFALEKLKKDSEKENLLLSKLVVCSNLGNKNSKILFKNFKNFKNCEIKKPFCFILPGNLHFTEKEFLEGIK